MRVCRGWCGGGGERAVVVRRLVVEVDLVVRGIGEDQGWGVEGG
jgi:hypothetical protein